MTDQGIIGKANRLPWHLPEDLKHFKQTTWGKPILMGRKTYESIGRILPGRRNVILTRNENYMAPEGAEVYSSIDSALKELKDESEVFVIGGGTIYEAAFPKADRLYLTLVHRAFEGDTSFPDFNLMENFQILSRERKRSTSHGGVDFSVIVAERNT